MWKSWLVCCRVFLVLFLSLLDHDNIAYCIPGNASASKRLFAYLSSNYGSPSVRPVTNISEPVTVQFRVLVTQVIEFDERKQHVQINGWRRQDWIDEFLYWDPAEYDGITSITYNYQNVWTPDLYLGENVGSDFISLFHSDVIVYSNGLVTWFNPIIVTSSCMVSVRYFPFDNQECEMTWMSWIYDNSGIRLEFPYDEDPNQNVFLQNGVWSLRNVSAIRRDVKYDCCVHPYSQIVYKLILQRSFGFYLLNIVMPSGLLAFVNCLVFLLPPESGERLGFAVSNLLAAILFQQLIGGIMPPLGDELPLLGMFFVYMILTNCFVLMSSIVILRFYYQRGDKPVPGCLRVLCRLKTPRESQLEPYSHNGKSSVYSANELNPEYIGNSINSSPPPPTISESLDLDYHSNGNHEHYGRRRSTTGTGQTLIERNINDWQAVSRSADNFLFAFIAITTIIVVMTIVMLFMLR